MNKYQILLDSVLAKEGKIRYLKLISDILNIPVAALYDKYGKLVAMYNGFRKGGNDRELDAVVNKMGSTIIKQCGTDRKIIEVRDAYQGRKKTLYGKCCVIASYGIHCVLSIFQTYPYKNDDIDDDLKYICSILALAFKNEREFLNCSQNDFLQVIFSDQVSVSQAKTICELNGFRYQQKSSCAIFKYDEIDPNVKSDSKVVRETLIRILNDHLEEWGFTLYNTDYHNHLVSFIFYPSGTSNQQILNFILDYYERVICEMNKHGWKLRVALGKYYSGVENIKKEVFQAFEAMNLGEIMHVKKRIYPYGCEQLFHILNSALEEEELRELFEDTIGILEKYDEDTNNNLVQVVINLINSGLNLTETARRMYIHRNTLLYKLEKVKEILESDPREPKLYVKLILGLYAKKLLRCDKDKLNSEDFV